MLGRATGAFDDDRFRDKFTQLRIDVADLTEAYSRFADILRRGEALGPDVSILKIFATATYQKITEALVELSAENGSIDEAVVLRQRAPRRARALLAVAARDDLRRLERDPAQYRGEAGAGFAGLSWR